MITITTADMYITSNGIMLYFILKNIKIITEFTCYLYCIVRRMAYVNIVEVSHGYIYKHMRSNMCSSIKIIVYIISYGYLLWIRIIH